VIGPANGYVVRPGPFRKYAAWRLADGVLVQGEDGRADRAWPLSSLRALRLAPGTNRYVPDETVLRLAFRRGAVSLGSHSFHRVGEYENQTQTFTPFVRALCVEAARLAPKARFESGSARVAGVFLGAMMLLGAGVVLLLLVALRAGASGLGLDLAARLGFGLLLMMAIQPWLSGAGVHRFDPLAPTPGALAGGRQ
jgi:hypothetical protein